MAHVARCRLASQFPRVLNPITRRTITTLTSHHLTHSTVQRTASSSSTHIHTVGHVSRRYFAVFTEKVPPLGDSISEGTVVSWQKPVGSWVEVDDVLLVIETDKVSVDFRATKSGVLKEQLVTEGATVKVGGDLAKIDPDAPKPAGAPAAKPAPAAAAAPSAPKAAPAAPATPAPAPAAAPSTPAPAAKPAAAAAPRPAAPTPTPVAGSRGERRVAMSRMRQTIAKRLKESQNTAALLTTFNEVDMTQIMELRNRYKDEFAEKHGTKLGFMSAFVKASARALQKFPDVNAVIDGTDTVYRDYVDVSVAVATPTGLVVPVLRNVETMSFAGIESAIAALGAKARKGAITIEDMVGGTFTISNGGVYGSLMGTPIVNQPQSAILGMHGIFKRPVAINDKVEIRPMMYIALTYDHRIIDGATAVQFLKEIKNNIEDPARLLLEL